MFIDSQREQLLGLHYPLNILELWCRNTRTYNDATEPRLRDLKAMPSCAGSNGGFNWSESPQGHNVWRQALIYHIYSPLYQSADAFFRAKRYIDLRKFD